MMPREPLVDYLTRRHRAMVSQLAEWVAPPSPSRDKVAVDRFSATVAQACAAPPLRGRVVRHPSAEVGDHLEVHWDCGGDGHAGDGQRLLLLAHLDTVFDDGGLAANPVRWEGDRLYGPGTLDMKAGALMILWAMQALAALGRSPRRPTRLAPSNARP